MIPIILGISSLLTPSAKINSLYHSLDPSSIAQALAFYELYPETKEGTLALQRVHELLGGDLILEGVNENLGKALKGVMSLVNRDTCIEKVILTDRELTYIKQLGRVLSNRKLRGYYARTEEEMLALDPSDYDLGRALLLTQLADNPEDLQTYEAMLDLMALQVKARLPPQSTPEQKIEWLNRFIFYEMHFRFPPHSLYAQDIDLYTFLPSVLDNHLGVCLGVTTLYLALAQRLDLPLEVVTPPGHIYCRYREGDKEINIETTARGVHMPTEIYLSVGTRASKIRNIKEVVGMTHVNQASIYLHRKDYSKALSSYKKAECYLPHDPLVDELIGVTYFLLGQEKEGRDYLSKVKGIVLDENVVAETRAIDILEGNADTGAIEAILMEVNDQRSSILEKKQALEKALESNPYFREGLIQLAVTHLQLNRTKEGLQTLKRYHAFDQTNPTVEYYLAALYAERKDYRSAWKHLDKAKAITQSRNHKSKTLNTLEKELERVSPS
ncbi:MAG: hypothetical protein KDK55_05835 [Chlamydiia bacterium]|nr:hypothetical protein [Chlamydiia bacterium]